MVLLVINAVHAFLHPVIVTEIFPPVLCWVRTVSEVWILEPFILFLVELRSAGCVEAGFINELLLIPRIQPLRLACGDVDAVVAADGDTCFSWCALFSGY